MLLLPFLPLFFHMALAAQSPVFVMTSPSSGYITTRSTNKSEVNHCPIRKSVNVPAKNVIMTSFRQTVGYRNQVILTGYFKDKRHPDGHYTENRVRLLDRIRDDHSDFAQLYSTTKIDVSVSCRTCCHTGCFKLFISFIPDDKKPVLLSNALWNCSVKDYASFRHHMACNLKTECEDGRDETGSCPYSSPECQGKIAMCNSCYMLVEDLHRVVSDKTDMNERANDHCNSLGGKLGIPLCVIDSVTAVMNKTKICGCRLFLALVGLYTEDQSLPNMYVLSVITLDKMVLHHSFNHNVPHIFTSKRCSKTVFYELDNGDEIISIYWEPCAHDPFQDATIICQFTGNNTEKAVYNARTIPLTSTDLTFPTGWQCMTECRDGHVTHTFFLCGSNQYNTCDQQSTSPCAFSDQLSYTDKVAYEHRVSIMPTFLCNDQLLAFSYTLMCDFINDCYDESDESFCKHPPCANMFRCANGQCVSVEHVCDYLIHCQDKSDEQNCLAFKKTNDGRKYFVPSPVLVNFDEIRSFISTPMNSNESCPDTHYRCPGDLNDCLPVYTRCNGMYDCTDHQDEQLCEEMKCPGFFKCRLSAICLHHDYICDDWSHCPMNDDELVCDITCSLNCLCQGHTFLCPQPFSTASFPQLRYLDASGANMSLSSVSNNPMLIGVILAHCSMHYLHNVKLMNLKLLDLSYNKLQHVSLTSFFGLENLQVLSLCNNPLTSIQFDLSSVNQPSALTVLDLSLTSLTVFDLTILSLFPGIEKLNLSFTSIHTMSPAQSMFTSQLTELYMVGSPVKIFSHNIMKTLSALRFIATENYKLCCKKIISYNTMDLSCIAPQDEISSCEDLLQSWTYRVFLWLIAILSVIGNVFCCCVRLFAKSMTLSTGFSVFVTNLTIADFLMGVYITIIGISDERYRGRYLYHDDTWKNSVTCATAGFVSLLSSEVSAFIIWLITLDRFLVLRFPFSTMRFDRTSAAVVSLLTWFTGWLLALVPLLPVTLHWEFYSQTGICIPLPVTRTDFQGKTYSFSVLIAVNFVLFVFISAGQACIFWTVKDNTLNIKSTKVSRDLTIARRLISIAVTDFMCWFPIGLCGMLALAGTPIPGEVNVSLAIFVLPLNSALNPFMYTFNTLSEKRRKSEEEKLLKWLDSHAELT